MYHRGLFVVKLLILSSVTLPQNALPENPSSQPQKILPTVAKKNPIPQPRNTLPAVVTENPCISLEKRCQEKRKALKSVNVWIDDMRAYVRRFQRKWSDVSKQCLALWGESGLSLPLGGDYSELADECMKKYFDFWNAYTQYCGAYETYRTSVESYIADLESCVRQKNPTCDKSVCSEETIKEFRFLLRMYSPYAADAEFRRDVSYMTYYSQFYGQSGFYPPPVLPPLPPKR